MIRYTKNVALALLPLVVSACSPGQGSLFPAGDPRPVDEVPPEILASAAPHQNLTNLQIQPEDGCYWWQWVGPVETTYLPLVTTDGRKICSRG